MAAYRRVYDSRHLQADCQEPLRNLMLGNRVWATFLPNFKAYMKKVESAKSFEMDKICMPR